MERAYLRTPYRAGALASALLLLGLAPACGGDDGVSTTADSSDTDTEGDTDTGGSTAGTTAGSDTDDTTAGPGGSDSTGSDSDTDTTTAPTTDPGTSEPTTDSDTTDATDPTDTTDPTTDPTTDTDTDTGEPGDVGSCFTDKFSELVPLADYDQYMPVIGSHCVGTDHQEIEGVQRVVFLGDSITVGSRPTLPQDVYRARLADMLRDHFGLAYGDAISEGLWKSPNPFTGETAVMSSGDFSSCARWGARNDDLAPPGNQLEDCFPAPDRQDTTLIVMTSGGNDVSSLAQDAIDGVPMEDLWATTEEFVQLERDALGWILAPGRFPNGVYVVYANIYEFTDGTGNVESCDVSGLAGFDQPVPNPEELTELILWANEQYMQMAVEHGVDMLFLLETFCGHGFANDDPTAPCYRGPDTPRWFDLTCIHPNPQGHGVIADEFMSIILE